MELKHLEKMPPRVKVEEQLGVLVPYLPSEQITHMTSSGEEVRDIVPLYISHLRTYARTRDPYYLELAFTSAAKEIMLHMNRGISLLSKGIEAPIAVSAEVSEGHVIYDGERIILNEAQAEKWKIDADGDRGMLVFNQQSKTVLLIKFPITQHPLILTLISQSPKEKFQDVIIPEIKSLEADEKELFMKAHMDAPVGLLTSAWAVENATRAMRHDNFIEALSEFCKDPQQCIDIEDGCMKAIRKDNTSATLANVVQNSTRAFAHEHIWALTGANSITQKTNPKSYNWIWHTDLTKNIEDILNLRFKFRNIDPREQEYKHEVQLDANLLYRLLPSEIPINGKMVHNPLAVLESGYLRYLEIEIPGMPPAVILFMTNAQGAICGLTDVKRLDKRDIDGLTFAHYLPPVFDNLELVDVNKNIIPASQRFVHPLLHMAKILSTTDTVVRNPVTMEATKYFPSRPKDMADPRYGVKLSILQKAITEYCGRYGIRAGASKEDGKMKFSPFALSTIRRTVIIDYGKPMNEQEMWEVAQIANSQRRLNLAGNKGTNRRIRKYALAKPDGTPEWAPEGCHPARPGKQLSQLAMAIMTSVKLRVAVVSMTTQTGVLITPSGIEKQMIDTVFLPEVIPTREEWNRRLENENLNPEDELNQPKTVEYDTWSGEKRIAFVSNPKASITIGKLIDTLGNKFLPRRYQQAYLNYNTNSEVSLEHQLNELNERVAKHYQGTKTLSKVRLKFLQERANIINKQLNSIQRTPIDLIMPITELEAKGCIEGFLKDATEEIVLIDGQKVKALVKEHTFYRTGCASENVPPRFRSAKYKGVDSFPIQYQMFKAFSKDPERQVNITFPQALKDAFLIIANQENFDPTKTFVEEGYSWEGELE